MRFVGGDACGAVTCFAGAVVFTSEGDEGRRRERAGVGAEGEGLRHVRKGSDSSVRDEAHRPRGVGDVVPVDDQAGGRERLHQGRAEVVAHVDRGGTRAAAEAVDGNEVGLEAQGGFDVIQDVVCRDLYPDGLIRPALAD
jgi:hypothetical protein